MMAVLKHWKVLVLIVMAAAWGWERNLRLSSEVIHAEQAAQALAVAQEQQRQAEARYAARAKADAATLQTLEEKVQELNAYLANDPDGSSACLSRADAERLRGLWE
ncbi:hypothetical protein LO749_20850 [Paracoccus denitrificans]|uniref:hypothetical protein n=1 Tax=Paracoccus denitrificans TaxID=266 RepID=UPI001E3BD1B3|nr:hypothetical protein [Paracoccus denitrificans]UFS66944.1 hypothetical protein LO749_20850 [Paracoccus denitrificans]